MTHDRDAERLGVLGIVCVQRSLFPLFINLFHIAVIMSSVFAHFQLTRTVWERASPMFSLHEAGYIMPLYAILEIFTLYFET